MNKQKTILLIMLLGIILSGCASNREGFYFGDYSEAEQLYKKGEYERAIQKYRMYGDQNPEGNLAIISEYYVAKSHLALGHKDEAHTIFNKIVNEHPQTVWANFSESQIKQLKAEQTVSKS